MSRRSTLSRPPRRFQRGMSLVEIMVGLVIGMIAVAVIFQVFATSEAFKRNATSTGDAQQNGLFSTFTMALELANAGNGLATSALDLATCNSTGVITTNVSAIPVYIKAGLSDDTSDEFTVVYSTANTLVYPALFVASAAAGTDYLVQSPNGFAKDDMVVAISGSGDCDVDRVTGISAPDANGVVTIAHAPVAGYVDHDQTSSSLLLNLGPASRAQRVRYDVAGGVLRSLDLINPDAVPNPLASNVVLMKVQYGVDNIPPADGMLDSWVKAQAPWDPASLMALPATLRARTINEIKAIRIGIIVRGAQYDKSITNDFNWVLFDCDNTDKTKCVNRLTGTISADVGGGGYRYRVYETVVPLRNNLWNRQL